VSLFDQEPSVTWLRLRRPQINQDVSNDKTEPNAKTLVNVSEVKLSEMWFPEDVIPQSVFSCVRFCFKEPVVTETFWLCSLL